MYKSARGGNAYFMIDILIDTIHDTLPMLPLLFLTYLLLEYIERKESFNIQKQLLSLKQLGPLFGAVLGIIPQCGFSVIAAGLYVDHAISLGTLIAVFISTSDEAIPILIAHPDHASLLPKVIVFKLCLAVIVGCCIDLFDKRKILRQPEASTPACSCHTHQQSLWKDAIFRTMKIFLFVFVVNFFLTWLIVWIGEEHLAKLLLDKSIVQPLIASVVGFIPNCAASVILAQLYISGVVSFGSLTAGLVTSAGLGLMVLLRSDHNRKEIVRILIILLLSAWISGTLLQIFA